MVQESIMFLIWNIFHFLRIIPKPGAGFINKIVLTMWLIMIITVGSFLCYFDFYFSGQSYTLSETITYLINDALIPFESLLIINELASLAELQWDLKTTLLYPKWPWYCLITTSMHFTSIPMLIYYEMVFSEEDYEEDSFMYKCYFVAVGLQYLMNFLLNSAASLVIGVAVSRLCKGVEDSLPNVGIENIQITIGLIISEYIIIKTKLSFLLFSLFIVNTILLTASSYYISKYFSWGYIPYLFYIMLQLSYIAYVLDECYSTLKASLPTLRYSCLLTEHLICVLKS